MFTAKERRQYIGGSDIAAIMGQSRWKTAYRLWAEKTGKIEVPDLSNNPAVEMGTRLEQFVAELFAEKTGKQVRRQSKMYQHSQYPYLVAHVDRLITGTDELLECKTCSAYKLEEWENKIPKEYVLQVIWYLGITGRKKGWIACLIGGQKFDYKCIEFDEELFNLMVEKAVKFWDMVQTQTPPVILPEDGEVLGEVFSEHTEDMIENNDINERVAYVKELEMHVDEMKKEIEEIKTELKATIKDKMGIVTDTYKVTWKGATRTLFDKETFQKEHEDLYNQYLLKSSYRTLRITKIKEKTKCKTNNGKT